MTNEDTLRANATMSPKQPAPGDPGPSTGSPSSTITAGKTHPHSRTSGDRSPAELYARYNLSPEAIASVRSQKPVIPSLLGPNSAPSAIFNDSFLGKAVSRGAHARAPNRSSSLQDHRHDTKAFRETRARYRAMTANEGSDCTESPDDQHDQANQDDGGDKENRFATMGNTLPIPGTEPSRKRPNTDEENAQLDSRWRACIDKYRELTRLAIERETPDPKTTDSKNHDSDSANSMSHLTMAEADPMDIDSNTPGPSTAGMTLPGMTTDSDMPGPMRARVVDHGTEGITWEQRVAEGLVGPYPRKPYRNPIRVTRLDPNSPYAYPRDKTLDDDLDYGYDAPRPVVTHYDRKSNNKQIERATRALAYAFDEVKNVLPDACIGHLSDIIDARAREKKEGGKTSETLDCFAKFIQYFGSQPELGPAIARHLNGNCELRGQPVQMTQWLMDGYGFELFHFDDPKEVDIWLAENWPMYHWVVGSFVIELALYASDWHTAAVAGRECQREFPPAQYLAWADWHLGQGMGGDF